jgi:hypothetical protein
VIEGGGNLRYVASPLVTAMIKGGKSDGGTSEGADKAKPYGVHGELSRFGL